MLLLLLTLTLLKEVLWRALWQGSLTLRTHHLLYVTSLMWPILRLWVMWKLLVLG